MIVKETYNQQTMKRLTAGIPRGTRQKIAVQFDLPYTTVCNVWSGKTWNEKVVRKLELIKQRTN